MRGDLRREKGNQRGENPFKGTPFEDFFNDRNGGIPFNMPEQRRTGVGAGVIIDRSGLVLTNNHVVEGATEVTVRLSDGREFKGTDIKTDKQTDLAIVRIEGAKDLHAATLGDSDALDIGDWVIAVGNPFNQEMTVSAGIISGKGRTLMGGQRTQYLQTDAAINPGNSGGPLVDLDGEVVGINTAIASSSGGFQGVGFAIPINQAKWVADQLTHGGAVKRAYLGVAVREVAGELGEQLGVKRHEGVLVGEVLPDSPAAKAGVQAGDVITEYAGKHVGTPGQLQQLVERSSLAGKEEVKIVRDGKPLTLSVGVQAMPEQPRDEVRNVRDSGDEDRRLPSYSSKEFGLEVADMTADEAEQLGFKGYEGVVITNVSPDGLAAERRPFRGHADHEDRQAKGHKRRRVQEGYCQRIGRPRRPALGPHVARKRLRSLEELTVFAWSVRRVARRFRVPSTAGRTWLPGSRISRGNATKSSVLACKSPQFASRRRKAPAFFLDSHRSRFKNSLARGEVGPCIRRSCWCTRHAD